MKQDYSEIQTVIGYQFKDIFLLSLALTHASRNNSGNYERLEFLGDRVLSLTIADALYAAFPKEAEGMLAKRHAHLVQASVLQEIATDIDLAKLLRTAENGNISSTMVSDSLEALFGAAYLDGGFQPANDLILRLYKGRITEMLEPPSDPKTALQEWAQGKALPVPSYEITERTGPDHAPSFTVSATILGFDPAFGTGNSRRAAEKQAASVLLERLLASGDKS